MEKEGCIGMKKKVVAMMMAAVMTAIGLMGCAPGYLALAV